MTAAELYGQLTCELEAQKDPAYAAFQRGLLGEGDFNLIGVRVPYLRKIAKRLARDINPKRYTLNLPFSSLSLLPALAVGAATTAVGRLDSNKNFCVQGALRFLTGEF